MPLRKLYYWHGQELWRYLNLKKLEDLVCKKALRFSNVQSFKDDLREGFIPKDVREKWLAAHSARDDAFFVSSWTISALDSVAMWKLYCQPNDEGLAVRTTFDAIDAAFGSCSRSIVAGFVKYVVHKDIASVKEKHEPYFFKRKHFEYENEYRLVIYDEPKNGQPAIHVPVDLSVLIDRIVISPFCSEASQKTISKLLSDNHLSPKIVASKLSDG